MAMAIPAKFKPVTQYIRRAERLDKASEPEAPVVAYYCRLYAVSQAFKLHDKTEESTQFLTTMMGRLEEDKKRGMEQFTEEEGKKMCTDWAMKEFSQADEEDRAGLSDSNTARAFYSAGVCFDVLRQFAEEGASDEEMDRRRIYCKWKASQILKAIKEGRAPTPGGAGEEVNTGMPSPSAMPSDTASIPTSPTMPTTPPAGGISGGESQNQYAQLAHMIPEAPASVPTAPTPAQEDPYHQPPAGGSVGPSRGGEYGGGGGGSGPLYPSGASGPPPSSPYMAHIAPAPAPYVAPAPAPYVAPAPAPAPQPTRPRTPVPSESGARRAGGKGRPQEGNMADAMEHCRYALRALEHKDVDLAVHKLQEALRQIT